MSNSATIRLNRDIQYIMFHQSEHFSNSVRGIDINKSCVQDGLFGIPQDIVINVDGKIDLSRINAIVLLSFKNQGSGKDLDNWALTDNDVRLILPYLRDAKTKFKIGADSCLFCKIGRVDDFTKQEKLFTDTCESSRASLYIDCTMKLKPCSYSSEGSVDLRNNTIIEGWNGQLFEDFRKKLKNDPYKCPLGF